MERQRLQAIEIIADIWLICQVLERWHCCAYSRKIDSAMIGLLILQKRIKWIENYSQVSKDELQQQLKGELADLLDEEDAKAYL